MKKQNPWDDFKPIASSRRPSKNTPGMLLLAMVFAGIIGFGLGGVATAYVIVSESDDRRYQRRTSGPTFAQENLKWFVIAGGLLGAGSLMGTVWKYWPKDLD